MTNSIIHTYNMSTKYIWIVLQYFKYSYLLLKLIPTIVVKILKIVKEIL